MFKWLFPLFFMTLAATAQAQSQPPSGPLYDPQGRLIPYDPPTAVNEAPHPVSKPKASAKKKPGKKSAAKPATAKAKPKPKPAKTQKSGKRSTSAKKKKSSAKTGSTGKKKPSP